LHFSGVRGQATKRTRTWIGGGSFFLSWLFRLPLYLYGVPGLAGDAPPRQPQQVRERHHRLPAVRAMGLRFGPLRVSLPVFVSYALVT